jgi:hypothetical protein
MALSQAAETRSVAHLLCNHLAFIVHQRPLPIEQQTRGTHRPSIHLCHHHHHHYHHHQHHHQHQQQQQQQQQQQLYTLPAQASYVCVGKVEEGGG